MKIFSSESEIQMPSVPPYYKIDKPKIFNTTKQFNRTFDAFLTCGRLEKIKDGDDNAMVVYVHEQPKGYKAKMRDMHEYIKMIHEICKLQFCIKLASNLVQ